MIELCFASGQSLNCLADLKLPSRQPFQLKVLIANEIVFISQAVGGGEGGALPEKCAAELGMVFRVLRVYKFTI